MGVLAASTHAAGYCNNPLSARFPFPDLQFPGKTPGPIHRKTISSPGQKNQITMNDLLPRPYDAIAYGFTLILSLVMIVSILVFITTRCGRILEETGTGGACGVGVGWILFCIAFLAIAAYSAWQLHGVLREKK